MSGDQPVKLRIFSLNCWGIRYMTQHCAQRYEMIGELLSKEEHDLALLQEVWSEKDYLFLKKTLANTYLYSHHFKSGVTGSGLAVFSRHKIHNAFLYRFSVNGHPYMAHHGDWFGGKGVGMVVVDIFGLTAHVYVTQLHAEYCREKDGYLPHRVVQAWELAQFVRHTSSGADVVILGGDLNMHPQDLGSRLFRMYTGLRDCYCDTDKFDGCDEGVTLIKDNPFTNKKELLPYKKGIRIDYILFKGSSRVRARCRSLSTTKGSVPGKPFPYSDHEALSAELLLERTQEGGANEGGWDSYSADSLGELVDTVTEARTEVKVGLHLAERMRHTAGRTGAMGLVLLLLELAIAAVPWLAPGAEQPFPHASFYLLGALCLAVLLVSCLLYLYQTTQVKTLRGAEYQMRLVTGSLQEALQGHVEANHQVAPNPPAPTPQDPEE